jgi:hypothetical protein
MLFLLVTIYDLHTTNYSMEITMKRTILAIAALAMTSGIALADHSRYGDAAPRSVVVNPARALELRAAASLRAPGSRDSALGRSSRYIYGDAAPESVVVNPPAASIFTGTAALQEPGRSTSSPFFNDRYGDAAPPMH